MKDARSKVERKHAAGPMARREKARSRERTQRRKHAAEKARSRDGFTQNREVPRRPMFRDDRAESTEQGRNGRHTNRRRVFVRWSELGKARIRLYPTQTIYYRKLYSGALRRSSLEPS